MGYNIPVAPLADRPSSSNRAGPSSSQKPGIAPLRVDVGSKPVQTGSGDTPPSPFSATSPIASPLSPALDASYSRLTTLPPAPQGSNRQISRAHSGGGGGGGDGYLGNSDDSDDDGQPQGISSHNPNWPVFAPADGEVEFEYQTDSPAFGYTILDSPGDGLNSSPTVETHNSFAAIQPAFNSFPTLGLRKSSSRVAFQASLGAQAQRQMFLSCPLHHNNI